MPFERVLVGFDGSHVSERALAVALALRADDGRLESLTVAETHFAAHTGMESAAWDVRLRENAESARKLAAAELKNVQRADATTTCGYAADALLHAGERLGADLIAVGAHGHSRAAGILLGSVATQVIHDARCSVLVARGSGSQRDFPQSVVVGIDGSPTSLRAAAIADAVAGSRGSHVRRLEADAPVEALVDASRSADLIVVGSRGVRGIAALGSVAERVAHQAACSVLIVRGSSGADTRPDSRNDDTVSHPAPVR